MTDLTAVNEEEGMMGSVYYDPHQTWSASTNNLSNISTGQTSMPMTSIPLTRGGTIGTNIPSYQIASTPIWTTNEDTTSTRLDAIEAKMDEMMKLLQDLRDGLELATAALNFP